MFSENLKVVREEFNSAMDLNAGRNLKVKNIFEAIEDLEQGKYNTLKEMHQTANFTSQNKVFQVVSTMLNDLGTPLSSLTKGKTKAQLDGTAFALSILSKNGMSLPEKKVKETEEQDSVSL